MKLYLSKSHSDEDDDEYAQEGVYGLLFSSKEDILSMCDFFAEVKEHLTDNETCHMHFRDSHKNWNKNKHIDIEVNTLDE